jgi:hypothetical protein
MYLRAKPLAGWIHRLEFLDTLRFLERAGAQAEACEYEAAIRWGGTRR